MFLVTGECRNMLDETRLRLLSKAAPKRRTISFAYIHDPYQSHHRVGRVYEDLILEILPRVNRDEDADIVIIHQQPWRIASLYKRLPWLKKKYTISYCTWEASLLPPVYQDALAMVDEVWTCSRYCHDILRQCHERVFIIPHVIERDMDFSSRDRKLMERLIDFDSGCFYFLNFGDTRGHRKNTHGLVESFLETKPYMPNARLLVIGAPEFPTLNVDDERIIHLNLRFSLGQVNALYSLSNAYVSPHHSEGWGLTLSDAMLFGKPVVATRYSGNLDFMNDGNSYLISAKEVKIASELLHHYFTKEMSWADPNFQEMLVQMEGLYSGRLHEESLLKAAQASRDIEKFSRAAVRQHLEIRLGELAKLF